MYSDLALGVPGVSHITLRGSTAPSYSLCRCLTLPDCWFASASGGTEPGSLGKTKSNSLRCIGWSPMAALLQGKAVGSGQKADHCASNFPALTCPLSIVI